MLYSLSDLEQFTLNAADGYLGKVKDFYVDDRTWKLRYVVVEAGLWFKHQKVLIPTSAIKTVNQEDKNLALDLSMYQVKNCQTIAKQLSLTPQTEIDYLSYYGYSFYRSVSEAHGFDKDAEAKLAETFADIDAVRRTLGDSHLRSCQEIINYEVAATDNDVGYLQTMLFEDSDWSVGYLVVDTSSWWLGHQVLLDSKSVKDINWGDARICVNMMRCEVQSAPIFDAETLNGFNQASDYLHPSESIYDKAPLFKLV